MDTALDCTINHTDSLEKCTIFNTLELMEMNSVTVSNIYKYNVYWACKYTHVYIYIWTEYKSTAHKCVHLFIFFWQQQQQH